MRTKVCMLVPACFFVVLPCCATEDSASRESTKYSGVVLCEGEKSNGVVLIDGVRPNNSVIIETADVRNGEYQQSVDCRVGSRVSLTAVVKGCGRLELTVDCRSGVQDFNISRSSDSMVGLGLSLTTVSGDVSVSDVSSCGPANGTLLPGDIIEKVNDLTISSVEQAVYAIRGTEGESVLLSVRRGKLPLTLSLVRRTVDRNCKGPT